MNVPVAVSKTGEKLRDFERITVQIVLRSEARNQSVILCYLTIVVRLQTFCPSLIRIPSPPSIKSGLFFLISCSRANTQLIRVYNCLSRTWILW